MAGLSGLKEAGSQALGNIETAILEIHDYRETASASGAPGNPAGGAAGSVGAAAQTALTTGQSSARNSGTKRTMRVKFNPSQLTVNASAVHLSKKNAENAESRTVSTQQAKLNLTVMLFFDDMDTYDSFMWDKYVTSLGTVQGAANMGKTVKQVKGQGKAHSVQPEVESLIAALRNPYTRLITFRWNEFVFTGSLNTVQAKYTMFSTSGRPVRAQMLLRIQHEMRPSLLVGWYASFQKAFGSGSTDLTRMGQSAGNLLNLNL